MLDYCEIIPRPPLSRFVECLWRLSDGGSPPTSPAPEPILPDGRMEIVLNCGAPFRRDHANGATELQPVRMGVGQMQRPLVIAPTGGVDLVGIRFRPAGASAFLGMPMSELAGRTFPLDEIAPRLDRALAQALDVTPSLRMATMEAALSRWLRSPAHQPDAAAWLDPATDAAVRVLVQSGGRASLDALAAAAGIGPRQLERRFLHSVGLRPKLVARILRFQSVFRALAKESERSVDAGASTSPALGRHDRSHPTHWAAVAIECGYYDQAHLIRDFREFAGQPPALLFEADTSLTHLFTTAQRHAQAPA